MECAASLVVQAAAGTLSSVKLHPAAVLLALPLVGLPATGCAHRRAAGLETPDIAPPRTVEGLDDFEHVFNEFVLIDDDHPARDAYRRALMAFLLGYIDQALDATDEAEALSALQYATALFSPTELRVAPPHPELARRAHAIYRVAARRGAEDPSLLALAVEQRFGDPKARNEAVENWETLEAWVVGNGPYATEPLLRHEELERSLEQVAAVFPSPFVTKRLADLYVARYEAARNGGGRGRALGTAALRRMEITGYLLMRVYLRADDPEGALEAMGRVELDPPAAKLRDIMVDAMKPRRSALPLLALAEQFVPEPDADPSQPYVIQGWGIVDNLSRAAVRRHPKDAYAHLLRARFLDSSGLTAASIHHLRRTIALKEDIFDAWKALAQLEHQHLRDLVDRDPLTAVDYLPEIESLHRRAAKLWSDRPLSPGLPEALYTVAEGLYHAGEVSRAETLLERSLGIEPVPDSIDLLGTIALKRSQLDRAEERYENLARLAFDSEVAKLRWEARALQQLGEIALRQGDTARSTRHIRAALEHTNDLLSRPARDAEERARRHVDRGKLLFLLGDVALAMEDFRKAITLAPDSVQSYADPLRYVVSHGYYDQARDIFRRAMARNALPRSLKLYFCLWLNELALRQGLPPDAEASAYLADYSDDRWGKSLAEHARGEIDFDQLLASAAGRGERAEAYFYEGLERWRSGDLEGAKKLLRKVLGTEMMGFFEYDMAQSYLEWNDLPRHARPALPTSAAKSSLR